jgi:hypothetical protein
MVCELGVKNPAYSSSIGNCDESEEDRLNVSSRARLEGNEQLEMSSKIYCSINTSARGMKHDLKEATVAGEFLQDASFPQG